MKHRQNRICIFPKKKCRWPRGTGRRSASPVMREKQIRTTARCHLTPAKMAIIEKNTACPPATPTRTRRSEPLCPADGKCCSHHGDHDGGFSADQHWNDHMIQIPLLGPRKTRNTKTRHAPQCSELHYLQQPKHGSIPSVHRQIKKTRCIHAMECQP